MDAALLNEVRWLADIAQYGRGFRPTPVFTHKGFQDLQQWLYQASLNAAQTVWVGVDNQGLRGLLGSDQKALAGKIDEAYATSM
jgi:hypothetical protein